MTKRIRRGKRLAAFTEALSRGEELFWFETTVHRPEYQVLKQAIYRCHNPRHKGFADYGGRGIRVCDEWREPYLGFIRFMTHIGPRPEHDSDGSSYTIDRIDNNGHYEPGNVRWATRTENAGNKRDNLWITWEGRTMIQADWLRAGGVERSTYSCRVMLANWHPTVAAVTPNGVGVEEAHERAGLPRPPAKPKTDGQRRSVRICSRIARGWARDLASEAPTGMSHVDALKAWRT